MGIERLDYFDTAGRVRDAGAYFVYTAFAPVIDPAGARNGVLVKVGISSVPFERMIPLHCNSPFPVELAAFALVGRKKTALRVESRILQHFREYKTRGEWLWLPDTEEVKGEFSLRTRAFIADATGKPVTWRRITGKQIVEAMTNRLDRQATPRKVRPSLVSRKNR